MKLGMLCTNVCVCTFLVRVMPLNWNYLMISISGIVYTYSHTIFIYRFLLLEDFIHVFWSSLIDIITILCIKKTSKLLHIPVSIPPCTNFNRQNRKQWKRKIAWNCLTITVELNLYKFKLYYFHIVVSDSVRFVMGIDDGEYVNIVTEMCLFNLCIKLSMRTSVQWVRIRVFVCRARSGASYRLKDY